MCVCVCVTVSDLFSGVEFSDRRQQPQQESVSVASASVLLAASRRHTSIANRNAARVST